MAQCLKLLWVGCGIVDSEGLLEDGLLQQAAVRIIVLLTEPSSWRIVDGSEAIKSLMLELSQRPPLFSAFTRSLALPTAWPKAQGRIETLDKFDHCAVADVLPLMKIVVAVMTDVSTRPSFQSNQLTCFIKTVFTLSNLWERLSSCIPPAVLIEHTVPPIPLVASQDVCL